MLVDSHCHLDLLQEKGLIVDEVIQRARSQGVTTLLTVSTRLRTIPLLFEFTKQYKDVFMSVGIHPNEEESIELETLLELGQSAKVVAIGETGLDYYRTTGDKAPQQEQFRTHIAAALALNKPLIIHTRDAAVDTVKLLRETGASAVGGVMHCFSESWEVAVEAMALGFYISFSGIVTFKNAKLLQEVAARVPLDRLLVETDSPYLAPEPHRGKTNEPSYVVHTAQFIAQLRGVSFETIVQATTNNFFNLFKG